MARGKRDKGASDYDSNSTDFCFRGEGTHNPERWSVCKDQSFQAGTAKRQKGVRVQRRLKFPILAFSWLLLWVTSE